MASHRKNPFNGLRAFDYAQRARFFGRERQSYALYRLTAFGFIAVIGNSGSGKSSLVRAGLLPLLFDEQEQQPWRVAVMTPGGSPLERLASAIATLAPEREDNDAHAVRFERIRYLLERSSNGIADALDEMPELTDTSVLLVVDQFEEIFRIDAESREETAAFVALLLQLHRRRPSAHVLITMRSDFIGDCARFSGLPEAVSDTQYLVPSLSREQRQAAIVKPIARAGATIEPTLVERLINEVGFESDQLPVLQHALARMWLAASDRVALSNSQTLELTEDDYRAIGTLDGALSQHADAIMAELAGREHVVEAVFRALSERDAESRATRRVLTLRQLVAETGMPEVDVVAVVDRFRATDCAFLLPAGGGLTPETRIDVVHEALLRRWKRLTPSDPDERGWLEREEEDGRYYRSLLARIDSGETTLQLGSVDERYAWWTSIPHTNAWAMRYGGRHARVKAFFAASLTALAESERAREQAEADERERRKQKERASRRFLIVSGSISAIAILLLIVTFFALLGSQRTTNASLVTQSELVARDAEALLDRGDATNAALLALEVLPQHLADPDRPFTWAAYGALTDALANMREVRDYRLSAHPNQVEYSPDGSRFIAHQSDGTIWIWKLGAPNPEHVLRAQSYARDVEFSADGKLVVAGSNDGSIHLWNERTGKLIRVLHYRGAVDRTIFSADGRRLLTSSSDDNVTNLYDVRSGRMLREVRGGITELFACTLGTFDKRVITIDAPKSVTLWDASLTKAQHVFSAPPASVVDARLSHDEAKLAIAYNDNSTNIYDARNGRLLTRLMSRDRSIDRIQFSTDATRLVTSGENYARVWDTSTGAVLATISANRPYFSNFPLLSRDGQKLVLPSYDGSLGIYSAQLGYRLVTVARKIAEEESATFNLDGSRLLVANSSDNVVGEWNISATAPTVVATNGASNHVALAPGGGLFAIGDGVGIHVFDARTGRNVQTLRQINSVDWPESAFSPDGRTLLVARTNLHGIERYDWKRSKRLPPFIDGTANGRLIVNVLGTVQDPSYSPDGKSFVSVLRRLILIQDSRTGSTRLRISANRYPVASAQFSADGKRLVAGGYDGWIRVYDARTGRPIIAFLAHRNRLTSVRFSLDGRLLASASSDQSVRVWNASNGSLVASLDTKGAMYSLAFSSDGKRLLIGGDEGVRIWDFTTDRTIVAFRGFSDTINVAEFALHDTRVITVGSDNTVRLWTVPKLPSCQGAIDKTHELMAHELTPELRKAEFITPRHSPSILNALLPSQACS